MENQHVPSVPDESLAAKKPLGILLSYQPIYADNKTVAAYDILLAQNESDCATTLTNLASHVVLSTYADIYQNGQIENVPHFLHVTQTMLQEPLLAALPRTQYILEFALPDNPSAEWVEQVRNLAKKGYRLALSGFQPDNDIPEDLMQDVEIVRLNLRALGMAGLIDAARALYFHKVKLLVDGIDDIEQFHACKDLGISYFQGKFLSRVQPKPGKKVGGNKLLLLELLSELNNPETTTAKLEQIILKDANLSYRILKIINSAAVGLGRKVESLSEAINLLGTAGLGRWINLLLVHGEEGKPDELMRSSLIRGRMCEDLANLSNAGGLSRFFITGLLSQLDVLMDIPMPDLMGAVPLGSDIKQALLGQGGQTGQILAEVENYLDGHFDQLTWLVDPPLYEIIYRHSVSWAFQAQQAMHMA